MMTTERCGKKTYGCWGIVCIFLIITSLQILGWHEQVEASNIKISVVYNDVLFDTRLDAEERFSCLIEGMEQTILFDTGYGRKANDILLKNMKLMGISPKAVDIIFLSHEHLTGGLFGFLKQNSNVVVYLLESFHDLYKQEIKKVGAEYKAIKEPANLFGQAHSTGEMESDPNEQSLIIETPEGLVIITGCSHPGIVNVVKKSKELINDNVLLILGGFHLESETEQQIEAIIDELKTLGVKKVAPSACTGKKATDLFRKAWGNNFLEGGLGAIIEIPR